MSKTAQKGSSTTQLFTEVIDIVDNIVLLKGGNACSVIEITSSNFALLSRAEQDSRIFSYASLLNSLTFPIQIIIRNKRMDITTYLTHLDEQAKVVNNPLLAKHIALYKEFVTEMIKVNVVLSKTFYIAIPFTSLEAGAVGLSQTAKKGESATNATAELAQKILLPKVDSLLSQLQKFAVSAKLLQKEELVSLFYDIFNDNSVNIEATGTGVNSAIIQQGGQTT